MLTLGVTVKKLIEDFRKLNDIFSLDFKDLQSFEDFKATVWPIGEMRELGKGILSQKIAEGPTFLSFDVTIPPKAKFAVHWHNCLEECLIKEGVLLDPVAYPGKVFKKGSRYVVEEMTKHQPLNPSDNEPLKLIANFKL